MTISEMDAGKKTLWHVHLSVEGVLSRRSLQGIRLTDKATGRRMNANETRRELVSLLARGVHCLPFGEPCDGWTDKLVALRAEWVDLAEGVLHVRASHARATTKTGKVREAPLFDDVRPFAARAFERVGGTGLLFPSPRGGGRLGRDLHCSAWVQRALVDLGIKKRMRFHDLRHTAATLMLEAGMDPHAVADILGHDMRVLESTYSHLGRRYRAREIQKMNKRASNH